MKPKLQVKASCSQKHIPAARLEGLELCSTAKHYLNLSSQLIPEAVGTQKNQKGSLTLRVS